MLYYVTVVNVCVYSGVCVCLVMDLSLQQGYGQGNGSSSYGGQSYAGYGQTGGKCLMND